MSPDTTHILESAAVAPVQGHKGKYAHNECRHTQIQKHENFVIKYTIYEIKKFHGIIEDWEISQ